MRFQGKCVSSNIAWNDVALNLQEIKLVITSVSIEIKLGPSGSLHVSRCYYVVTIPRH